MICPHCKSIFLQLLFFCFGSFSDLEWFNNISFNHCDIITEVKTAKFAEKSTIEKHIQPSWLLKAINCIDLATLVGNETPEDISKLCKQVRF